MIRLCDIIISTIGIVLLLPVFLLVAIWIKLDSKGPVLYRQIRAGMHNKDFKLLKFRSMRIDADKAGLLTVGKRDSRVTKAGYFLRRYKIDEFPQLINVLFGEMSLVGPRPELRKYVDMYSEEQKKILQVRPGITDVASIAYKSENAMLEKSPEPERTYIEQIMPDKIRLNMEFIDHPGVIKYFAIIIKTLFNMLHRNKGYLL
jgi:lipopolysaccharide/colanic/teichoic acid biosynthesis glycosyltransferase